MDPARKRSGQRSRERLRWLQRRVTIVQTITENPAGETSAPRRVTEEMLMRCPHKTIAMPVVSLFLAASTTLVGAEGLKTPQEVLDFASSKMPTYKTWSADYSQDMNVLGNKVAMTGQVVQKPPHRVWMRISMPVMGQQTQMTMVMGQDGIIWQVVKMGSQQQVVKMDVNKLDGKTLAAAGMKGNPLDQFDPGKQLESTREMCDFSLAGGRELDGQPMYTLDGTWKAAVLTNEQMAAAAALVGKTRVFIGQTDGFVHRLEQYDKSQTNLVMAMEFKNLKFNQDVSDAMFVYQPSPDAHVIDVTPTGGARMSVKPHEENAPPQPPTAPTP
jgi:outer membrane lipoprotein-sorting protein